MWVEQVPVVEDGTLNGVVCHQTVVTAPKNCDYDISTCSYGIGHPKHGSHSDVGAAGQDVYGHTSNSIYVADGHGKDGLNAAEQAIRVVPILEQAIDPNELLKRPEMQAVRLRAIMVDHLQVAEFDTSGATFTQMTLVASKGRRWVITVNIGDSEALLVYRNRVCVCSSAHVWDNRDMYQRYVNHSKIVKPVCYNRWNASDYTLRDPNGEHRPMMLYQVERGVVTVNEQNVKWVSELWQRRQRPEIRFGTQSIRRHAGRHENWGSCVMVGGRARGQVMATYGDLAERHQAGVPFEMVHVYIHEVPEGEDVVAVVQSDGVANSRTLIECGQMAWCERDVETYLKTISDPRDDLSVGMAYFSFAK